MVNLPWLEEENYGTKYPQYGSYPQTAGGSTNLLSFLLQSYPAVKYGMQGIDTRPQRNLAGKLGEIGAAQTDIDNPMYQRIFGQQRQQNQQNLAESIAELTRQNRKLSALGRTPLFDQGRSGEMIFRNLTRGYQDAQDQAADQTHNILSNAANIYKEQGDVNKSVASLDMLNKQTKTLGYFNLGEAFKNLFGL